MKALSLETHIKPIVGKYRGSNIVSIMLTACAAYWLYHCWRILSEGLTTLGIDTYSATWGVLVANTVHIIGISHVGIAISAAVRVLHLDRYRNIARLAELVTVIALVMAVANLLLHVGRPDRFILNVVLYGKWHSPMVWSMTVFTTYFLASSVYLYLSMRRDLWSMSNITDRFGKLYRFLTFGYTDSSDQRARHERTLFWMALILIPIMVSVHSVYGLLFGMISAQAGWYNPLQAPYFVLGAIVSGFSAIIVIAALLRKTFAWQQLLTDQLFKAFGAFLTFVVFLYLYFILSEQLTSQYLPMESERAVSDSLLTGRFAVSFWTATSLGLILPFVYLLVQSVKRNYVHIGLTAMSAVLINVAMWVKRYLIVVPTQYQANLPMARPSFEYTPTYTEWVVTLGSYVVAALILVFLLRLLPLFELPVVTEQVSATHLTDRPSARRVVMVLSLISGLLMIAWGVATREGDFGPVKWLTGIVFLLVIPMANCLIDITPREPEGKSKVQH